MQPIAVAVGLTVTSWHSRRCSPARSSPTWPHTPASSSPSTGRALTAYSTLAVLTLIVALYATARAKVR